MNRKGPAESFAFRRAGFTLIEMMVVVAIMAVIMTVIMAIMANTFKANNRTKAMQKINENGSYAVEQIKRYYLSQSVCDETMLSINGTTKVLELGGTGITKDDVIASGIGTTCNGNVLEVGFTLSVGSNLSKDFISSKSFTTTVVLRN